MSKGIRGIGLLLRVMVFGLVLAPSGTLLWAQDAAAGADTGRGLVETGRQSVQAVGEATSEFGGALRAGGQQGLDQGRKLWQEVLVPVWQRLAAAAPGVLKALLLLLGFWVAGRLAGAAVRKLLNLTQIDDRAVRDWGLEGMLKQADGSTRSLAGLAGSAVKWVLLLFGFVAFFNALNLGMVAAPLQNIVNRIFSAIPSLIKAAAILLVYWALAAVARLGITRLLGAVKFDSRAARHLACPAAEGEPGSTPPSAMIGRLVFYIILLFGVPPFLQALGQQALVAPLQEMLAKALTFLPNLFAAAIIFVVGRIVASIVREVVGNFLSASGADAGAEKLGLGKMLGELKLSVIASRIAYFFILIPILVSAVDSLGIKTISEPIKATLQSILAAVPALLVATVIVVVGCVVARVVRSLVEGFLGGIGVDQLPQRLGLDFLAARPGQTPPSRLIGAAVSVVIILITAQQAAASLKFDQLAGLVGRIVAYLPNLVVGLAILLAALSLGRYLGALTASTLEGSPNAKVLATVTRYAVYLLGFSMALEQFGIGEEVVMIGVSALLGGAAIAVGLAFGLGGKAQAQAWIEQWQKKE